MVEVVGVIVAIPAPMSQATVTKLEPKPVEPACGKVTAIEAAFENERYVDLSVASTVYVVPT